MNLYGPFGFMRKEILELKDETASAKLFFKVQGNDYISYIFSSKTSCILAVGTILLLDFLGNHSTC